MKQFKIECGAAAPSQAEAIAMDVHGPGKNVNLRIDYITRTMLGNLPDLMIDLLEVAAYVYCADQRLQRGSLQLTNFGESWRRGLHFSIPVRNPEVWQQDEVQSLLVDTLGFLSDDSYSFDFRKASAPRQPPDVYFHDLIDASRETDEVAMFSGGVDSFAGALMDLVLEKRSVRLVGHYSSPKVRNVQESLVSAIKQRGFQPRLSYIPVWVTNTNITPNGYTQRARSFLFACLGLVIARMSGKNAFTFYENGVVSINPPFAGDVVGGRATRTTHPRVLRGLEELFSTLLERPISIRNPLQWLTKYEVTQNIEKAGMSDLLSMTSSCTRPYIWTTKQKHCGVCSQCIDRRFGILAAGMAEFEPAENYRIELLKGDRSSKDDLRMALSYVSFFKKVGSTTKERFLADFPEVVSALGSFPDLSPSEAGDQIYNLFQRQAKAVESVIAAGVEANARALFRNELPATSLLAASFSRGGVEVAPPSDYDEQAKALIDRLSAPILEFAIDQRAKLVVFRDGTTLSGANFRCAEKLLGNYRNSKAASREIPFLPPAELADRLGISDQAMRQQLTRLRNAIEPLSVSLGVVLDQDSFIENKERAGYRLNPALRELSLADIKGTPTP